MSDNYKIIIGSQQFEWDIMKAHTNMQKHNVSFMEAVTAFYDESAILFNDPKHLFEEERFLLVGFSKSSRMLTVCHCVRESDSIRIISARRATKKEEEKYDKTNRRR